MTTRYRLRTGTVQGVKHLQLGVNNQDAVLVQEFGIPQWGKTYQVGLISDGCSGLPVFTHNEVGANLMVVNCLGRIQELIVGGAGMQEIPVPLYHSVIDFMRNLANTIMPANVHWPYNVQFPAAHAFRTTISSTKRFTLDYLAATIAGFVDDGETLVVFRADDGIVAVNDDLFVVDQNNQPDYPALSVNTPGGGFKTSVYASADVPRLLMATDGLKPLTEGEFGVPGVFFAGDPENPMDLQTTLKIFRKEHGEKVGDDCTVLTRERIEV